MKSNKNLKNPLVDLSSDMGLTTRSLQSSLSLRDQSFIYEVRDLDGNRYRHCGSQKDADNHVMRNPGFTWEKVYLSPPPKTVDVDSVTLPPDPQLPESQAQPLNL